MNRSDLIDLNATIECSRGAFGNGEEDTFQQDMESPLRVNQTISSCPNDHQTPEQDSKRKEQMNVGVENIDELEHVQNSDGLEDKDNLTFDLSAFLVQYKAAGDDYLNVINGISPLQSDEDDDVPIPTRDVHVEPKQILGPKIEHENVVNNFQLTETILKEDLKARDKQIAILIASLEELTREKEDNIKDMLELKEQNDRLKDELRHLNESDEVEMDRNRYGPSELSSYLTLPESFSYHKMLIAKTSVPEACQTDLTKQIDSATQYDVIIHPESSTNTDQVISNVQETQTSPLKLLETASQHSFQTNEAEIQTQTISNQDFSIQIVPLTNNIETQFCFRVPQMEVTSQTEPSVTSTGTDARKLPSTLEFSSQVDRTEYMVNSGIQTETKELCDSSSEAITTSIDQENQVGVPYEEMELKYKGFTTNLCNIRKELGNLRSTVCSEQKSLGINCQNIFTIINKYLSQQKEEFDELQTKVVEAKIKELDSKHKLEVEEMEEKNTEILRLKEDEILDLKIKVAQLEYTKKMSDSKQLTFSSRVSPDGSELDVDVSLTDSTAQHRSQEFQMIPEQDEDFFNSNEAGITQTKLECLAVTPPLVDVDDEEVHQSHPLGILDNSLVEDLKLQIGDLEKKYIANLKYLEDQTAEHEYERDEFIKKNTEYIQKANDLQKEKGRLEEILLNQKLELDELESRFNEKDEIANQLLAKTEKVEAELQLAIDKIYQLREIIRDLEDQIDTSTENVGQLKEENEVLRDEVERLESFRRESEDAMNTSHETFVTATAEYSQDEIYSQLKDLADRLMKKLGELDNFKWSSTAFLSRPGSACSGRLSLAVSAEDISLRESGTFDVDAREVTASDIADGIRRLDVHFDNFLKFEEIMMKKLRDTELKLIQTIKRAEDLEIEKAACQEKLKEQLLRASDLETRLDELRFEPSPSTLTMNGLRKRIKNLNEELEEAKGELELKKIELVDMKEKLEASQAKAAVSAMASASFQANQAKSNDVALQTRVPRVVSTYAQTLLSDIKQAASHTVNFPWTLSDMDMSNIVGTQEPFHSTPTDQNDPKKLNSKGYKNFLTDLQNSPEYLRKEWDEHGITIDHAPLPVSFVSPKSSNTKLEMSCTTKISEYPKKQLVCGSNADCLVDACKPSPPSCAPKTTVSPVSATTTFERTQRRYSLKNFYNLISSTPAKHTHTGIPLLENSALSASLDRKLSTSTIHGIDSVNDLRSWSLSNENRRKYFMDQMIRDGTRTDREQPETSNARLPNGRPLVQVSEIQNLSEVEPPSGSQRLSSAGDPPKNPSETPQIQAVQSITRNSAEASNLLMPTSLSDTNGVRSSPAKEDLRDAPALATIANEEVFGIQGQSVSPNLKANDVEPVNAPANSAKPNKAGVSPEQRLDLAGILMEHENEEHNTKEDSINSQGTSQDLSKIESDSSNGAKIETPQSPLESTNDSSALVFKDENYVIEANQEESQTSNSKEEYDLSDVKGIEPEQNPLSDIKDDEGMSKSQPKKSLVESEERNSPEEEELIPGFSSKTVEPVEKYISKEMLPNEAETPSFEEIFQNETEEHGPIESLQKETEHVAAANGTERTLAKETSSTLNQLGNDGIQRLSISGTGSSDSSKAQAEKHCSEVLKNEVDLLKAEKLALEAKVHQLEEARSRIESSHETKTQVDPEEYRKMMKTLMELHQEKRDLECRLDSERIKEEKALEAERFKVQELFYKLEQLKQEKLEKEQKVKELSEISAKRMEQIELFQTRSLEEKKNLEAEVEAMKKELTEATKKERAVSDSLEIAKEVWTKQVAEDEKIRAENRQLLEELDAARRIPNSNSQRQVRPGERSVAALRQIFDRPLPECNPPLIPKEQEFGGDRVNLELYLRTKSYRKALTWQKKYLCLVIQEYKDLLDSTGAGFRHVDFINNEIPLAPSAIGLVDKRQINVRFRIYAKAVLAVIRMKFMVRRWKGRSQRVTVANILPPYNQRIGHIPSEYDYTVTDQSKGKRYAVPGLSLSSLSGGGGGSKPEVETVLSEYLKRIHAVEQVANELFKTREINLPIIDNRKR